jgi:hypothetical protein
LFEDPNGVLERKQQVVKVAPICKVLEREQQGGYGRNSIAGKRNLVDV